VVLASVQKHKKVTPETAALAERDGPCVFDVDGEAGAARLARWGEAPSGVSVALAEAWDDAARRGAGGTLPDA
jgi:hypothetical protein